MSNNFDEQSGVRFGVPVANMAEIKGDIRFKIKSLVRVYKRDKGEDTTAEVLEGEEKKKKEYTLEDMKEDYTTAIQPMLLIGDPGVGKTEIITGIVNEIAKEEGVEIGFKKILLGQTLIGELSGVPLVDPSKGSVVRAQSTDLPGEEDPDLGILFLDEFTTADIQQLQPAFSLCDGSRSTGVYTLPKYWLVVAAGNGPNSSNFVSLPDAILSRMAVYDIVYDYKTDWYAYAQVEGVNPLILTYLNLNGGDILHTTVEDSGRVKPCPRSWMALSRYLNSYERNVGPLTTEVVMRYAGRLIGTAVGDKLAQWVKYRETKAVGLNTPEKVLGGTYQLDGGVALKMKREEYHYILESTTQVLIKELYKVAGNPVDRAKLTEEIVDKVANLEKWLLEFGELVPGMRELVLSYYLHINTEGPVRVVLGSSLYEEKYKWISNKISESYSDLLLSNVTNLQALKDLRSM